MGLFENLNFIIEEKSKSTPLIKKCDLTKLIERAGGTVIQKS